MHTFRTRKCVATALNLLLFQIQPELPLNPLMVISPARDSSLFHFLATSLACPSADKTYFGCSKMVVVFSRWVLVSFPCEHMVCSVCDVYVACVVRVGRVVSL